MLSLHRPTESEIIQHLLNQRRAPYSYAHCGATKGILPAGFQVDRHRVRLGFGAATFARGRTALQHWNMYPTALAELCFPDRPTTPGTVIAALIQVGPIWSLNPCRVVYGIDDTTSDGVRRVGLAVGTLPDHAACGEERFLVEWHPDDDSVWYDLLAFSRPRHLLARGCYPYTRWLQRRFRLLSGAAMQAACQVGSSAVPVDRFAAAR